MIQTTGREKRRSGEIRSSMQECTLSFIRSASISLEVRSLNVHLSLLREFLVVLVSQICGNVKLKYLNNIMSDCQDIFTKLLLTALTFPLVPSAGFTDDFFLIKIYFIHITFVYVCIQCETLRLTASAK